MNKYLSSLYWCGNIEVYQQFDYDKLNTLTRKKMISSIGYAKVNDIYTLTKYGDKMVFNFRDIDKSSILDASGRMVQGMITSNAKDIVTGFEEMLGLNKMIRSNDDHSPKLSGKTNHIIALIQANRDEDLIIKGNKLILPAIKNFLQVEITLPTESSNHFMEKMTDYFNNLLKSREVVIK